MKKPLVILIGLLVISLFVVLGIFLIKEKGIFDSLRKNKPEIENLVSIQQAELSSFVFVIQDTPNNHILNINITPFFRLNISEKEIKSFKITNFQATNNNDKEVILVHPTNLAIDTVGRTFLFTTQESITLKDLKASENSIEYSVVSEVKKFNEVKNQGDVYPNFGVIISNIGSVDYESILKNEAVFDGTKYLEYSEIPLNTLDTDIRFDVIIEFTDGNLYTKRLVSKITGESFKSESTPIFPITEQE